MDDLQLKERIQRIPDGVPLNLGKMTINTSDSDKLLVTGWINTIQFENISKESVARELRELKKSFFKLSESYNDLKTIVKVNNLTIEYHMTYDDAGKVGIGLCSEINGIVNWYIQ